MPFPETPKERGIGPEIDHSNISKKENIDKRFKAVSEATDGTTLNNIVTDRAEKTAFAGTQPDWLPVDFVKKTFGDLSGWWPRYRPAWCCD